MKSILITGSTGFLGKELFNFFQTKYETYTLSNIVDSSNTDKHYVCDLSQEAPEFKHKFDLVIHAAGLAHFTPKSSDEINKFFEVNFQGTEALSKGLISLSPPKYFVFISTVSVYGCSNGTEISENTKLKATDPYGQSKILAENFLINWAKKNNVILTILRPTLIFGGSAPGNLLAMKEAIKKGYYSRIGQGDAKRSSIHISDIAPIINELYPKGGTYNLCSDQKLTIIDFENYFMRELNKNRIFKIPYFLGLLLAQIGNIFEFVTKKEFIFNTNKFKKLTTDLTFSNKKIKNKINYNFKNIFDKNIKEIN